MHFKMSSAICFSLDESKILSFAKGLMMTPRHRNDYESIKLISMDESNTIISAFIFQLRESHAISPMIYHF